jgi:hypothetical protein
MRGFTVLKEVKFVDSKGRVLLGQKYAGKIFQVEEELNHVILKPVVVVPEEWITLPLPWERNDKPGERTTETGK